jgi:hypothetical protein
MAGYKCKSLSCAPGCNKIFFEHVIFSWYKTLGLISNLHVKCLSEFYPQLNTGHITKSCGTVCKWQLIFGCWFIILTSRCTWRRYTCTEKCQTYDFLFIYMVNHKSFRNFQPLQYSSGDGDAEGKHVNRRTDAPIFCPTLQVLDMSTLGDATDASFWQIPRHRTLSYSLSTPCFVTTAPLAVKPASTPQLLVYKKNGEILYRLICSFLLCLSWLLCSRFRKFRRDLWITLYNFKLFVACIFSAYEMKNQQMSLFQFYSYIDGCLHVSGLQAHPQENSHSCSHNHWFSGCTVRAACSVCPRPERYNHWTNGCVNSYVNSPEDGPVGPKHVEIRRYTNKIEIVTSVGFSFHTLYK